MKKKKYVKPIIEDVDLSKAEEVITSSDEYTPVEETDVDPWGEDEV